MVKKINGYTIKYDPIYKDFLLINKDNEIVSKHYTYGLAVKEANKYKPQKDFNKSFEKYMSLCQSDYKKTRNNNIKNEKKSLLSKFNKKINKHENEENFENNKIKKLLEQFKE